VIALLAWLVSSHWVYVHGCIYVKRRGDFGLPALLCKLTPEGLHLLIVFRESTKDIKYVLMHETNLNLKCHLSYRHTSARGHVHANMRKSAAIATPAAVKLSSTCNAAAVVQQHLTTCGNVVTLHQFHDCMSTHYAY